ncbi:MAG: metallopeptidase TldD-related protein [Bdellovibrionota bacterium]|nr:metallopeptidase TldD-related protein [Bdellovibrionota bacterium]
MTNNESIEFLYDLAKKDSIEIEVVQIDGKSNSVTFLEKKLEEISIGEDFSLGVRLVKDQKEVFFSSESSKKEDLENLFKQQAEALQYAKPNDNIVLNDKIEASGEINAFFPEQVSSEQKVERTKELEELLWDCDENLKKVRETSFSESYSEVTLHNKLGDSSSYQKSYYSISSELLGEKDGKRASGHFSFTSHDYEDMISNEMFVERIKKHSLGLLGAKSPETGDYPIVFERKAFASLLSLVLPMLNADTVDQGFSLFDKKQGEKIASGLLHIENDPSYYKGLGRKPFDGEGNPTKKHCIIQDGVLNSFFSNNEYSKKLGIDNTHTASRSGNGRVGISPSNIVVRSGTLATTAIKAMKPSLIEIVRLNGLHAGFNSVTGDFSFQAEGFLYDFGNLVNPLQDFLVAGNIKDILMGIEDLGANVIDNGGSIICPDVLISSLKIIGS